MGHIHLGGDANACTGMGATGRINTSPFPPMQVQPPAQEPSLLDRLDAALSMASELNNGLSMIRARLTGEAEPAGTGNPPTPASVEYKLIELNSLLLSAAGTKNAVLQKLG